MTTPKWVPPFSFFSIFLTAIFVISFASNAESVDQKRRQAKSAETALIDAVVPFDGNRIFSYIVNDGHLTQYKNNKAGFYWPSVPRTSREQREEDLRGQTTADYSSGLWVAGIVNGQVRTAIVEYASEYLAGKILSNGKRDDATLPKYRIYKIMKGDGAGVKDWYEWPKEDGAPINADGTPQLIGDQTLWFVMNDLDAVRHQYPISGSPPIGLEVQTTVFGFNRSDPLRDVMFVKWVIINKGTADLDSAFVGLWDDPDIGDASDDLVGCDTTLGLGFCYNGDSYDKQYGERIPALGFDFLQGPQVPQGSGSFLMMTAFAKFYNCSICSNPDYPEEVYNVMNGRWQNGNPVIDPITGRITKFIHAGDPVTRRGDLDLYPGDRRFLISSGPFKLAKSDTQTVVGAKIIAPGGIAYGGNPASAITALRYFDKFAQTAFDLGFEIFTPPSPKIAARRLDQEIALTWLEDHEALESLTRGGYKFQGYRVHQGASPTGPFKPVATFDLVDDIQDIVDLHFDEISGLLYEKIVMTANDAGVQRHLSIKTDAIFNPNQRLSNYRDYYFAVTSYFIDLKAAPKVLESSINVIHVTPAAPDSNFSKTKLQKINVVPNPYWAHNPMEREPQQHLVRITNLPGQGAKIRIFTLAGDLVRVIDDADRRTDGTSGLQYVNWDLRNDHGYPVGSGVYLIHVEVPNVGIVARKAAIVMPQE